MGHHFVLTTTRHINSFLLSSVFFIQSATDNYICMILCTVTSPYFHTQGPIEVYYKDRNRSKIRQKNHRAKINITRVTQSIVLCLCFVDGLLSVSFRHRVVCLRIVMTCLVSPNSSPIDNIMLRFLCAAKFTTNFFVVGLNILLNTYIFLLYLLTMRPCLLTNVDYAILSN